MIATYQCPNYCVASLQASLSLCWTRLLPASSLDASSGFHMVQHWENVSPYQIVSDQVEHGDVSVSLLWVPPASWLTPL